MKALYIEPFSGLSGDMFLGSLCGLLDAYDEILDLPEKLNLPDGRIEIKPTEKNGIVCKQIRVIDLNETVRTVQNTITTMMNLKATTITVITIITIIIAI